MPRAVHGCGCRGGRLLQLAGWVDTTMATRSSGRLEEESAEEPSSVRDDFSAPRSCDPDNRDAAARPSFIRASTSGGKTGLLRVPRFCEADGACQQQAWPSRTACASKHQSRVWSFPDRSEHVRRSCLQAHPPAVLGRVNTLHTVLMQGPNLVGDDDTATPTEDFDGSAVVLVQQGDDVPKELVVTALIRADCDGVCVLLRCPP